MKYQNLLPSIFAASLCVIAAPFASADPTPEPAKPEAVASATPAVSATPAKADLGKRIDRRLNLLTKNLALTTEQQAKIRTIMETDLNETKNAEGGRGKKLEKMKKMRADIRVVLTPEQQTKYDGMEEKMHKKREAGENQPVEADGTKASE